MSAVSCMHEAHLFSILFFERCFVAVAMYTHTHGMHAHTQQHQRLQHQRLHYKPFKQALPVTIRKHVATAFSV
jgi:hypothetical protein